MKKISLTHKKFREIKTALENNNWNSENAYQEIMGNENLFGYAFFGWAASKYQRFKMNHIWRGVLFTQLEYNKTLREWQREQIRLFLEIKN